MQHSSLALGPHHTHLRRVPPLRLDENASSTSTTCCCQKHEDCLQLRGVCSLQLELCDGCDCHERAAGCGVHGERNERQGAAVARPHTTR